MRKSYFNLTLIIIFSILAGFLHFYRLPQITFFNSEQGSNYLAIKDIIETKKIPLVGPPTSHPWLYFGPLSYWLMTPILWLANFNPLGLAYFFGLIYTALVVLNFLVIRRFIDEKTALISSFLISISPIFATFSLWARFFCLIPFLLYFYIWQLGNFVETKKNIFWVGFLLGVILNFHLTALILIPATLNTLWFLHKKLNLFKFAVGLITPLSPLLIFDLKNHFQMIGKFFLWVPYRMAGFAHLYPKNNFTLMTLRETIFAFYQFLHLSFFPKNFPWQFSASFFLIIFYFMFLHRRFFHLKSFFGVFSVNLAFWGTLALIIHSSPPIHYFLPLLPLPIILISCLISKFKKPAEVILAGALLLSVFICSLRFYFSKDWFFQPIDQIRLNPHYVPYILQRQIVKVILKDTKNRSFSISRIGPYYEFTNDFSDNYTYLFWWFGQSPTIPESATNKYTIIEDPVKIPNQPGSNRILIKFSQVGILKTSRLFF